MSWAGWNIFFCIWGCSSDKIVQMETTFLRDAVVISGDLVVVPKEFRSIGEKKWIREVKWEPSEEIDILGNIKTGRENRCFAYTLLWLFASLVSTKGSYALMHLEGGLVPIRQLTISRRLIYLQNLLKIILHIK